jgi:hypothetical protein
MMSNREWRRVACETICGGCETRVPTNGPMLYIKLPNVRIERKRCERCAGPAPPDLPERTIPGNSTKRMPPISLTAHKFTRAKLSDQDWTARILGEKNS